MGPNARLSTAVLGATLVALLVVGTMLGLSNLIALGFLAWWVAKFWGVEIPRLAYLTATILLALAVAVVTWNGPVGNMTRLVPAPTDPFFETWWRRVERTRW